MGTHKNASLTPKGREAMARRAIDGGLSKAAAARRFNTTPKTVAKWVVRFRAKAVVGLQDRSSRPHSSPSQTAPAVCAAVEGLRRQRHTGAQIAAEVGVSAATVSRILKRRGLNRLSALGPAEPVRRYERAARARSSTSTSKSWASSVGPAIGSPATGPARATPAGSAGNMFIWRSTTIPASPTRKSCRTKNVGLAFAFSSTPCASFETSASGSSAS